MAFILTVSATGETTAHETLGDALRHAGCERWHEEEHSPRRLFHVFDSLEGHIEGRPVAFIEGSPDIDALVSEIVSGAISAGALDIPGNFVMTQYDVEYCFTFGASWNDVRDIQHQCAKSIEEKKAAQ